VVWQGSAGNRCPYADQWLGPKSKEVWTEIEDMWRGKNSLADVVRAEIKAAKNK
jgi:hypothetical protein